MRRFLRSESGTAAAEFAVTVPAAIAVVLLVVGALAAAGQAIELESAAAQAARLHGRDDPQAAAGVAERVGAAMTVTEDGDLVCVELRTALGGPLPLPDIRARSCALAGGL